MFLVELIASSFRDLISKQARLNAVVSAFLLEIQDLFALVAALKKEKTLQTFYYFSRLFPGLKSCFANFKTFSRVQDSIRTQNLHTKSSSHREQKKDMIYMY